VNVVKEALLNVKDLNSCRAFYLDLMIDAHILIEGSFMVKIQNGENILTLYSPNSIVPAPKSDNLGVTPIILTRDLMNDAYNILMQYNVKIFSVHYKDNDETIIEAIECCDPENHLIMIKGKEGSSLRKSKFFSRTQVLKI
jgi:hypothetical protein